MSKPCPAEQCARAVKMMLNHQGEYRSVYPAGQAIGPKLASARGNGQATSDKADSGGGQQ